jgi:hypothetical protein
MSFFFFEKPFVKHAIFDTKNEVIFISKCLIFRDDKNVTEQNSQGPFYIVWERQ